MNNKTRTTQRGKRAPTEDFPAFFRTLLERRGLTTDEAITRFLRPDYERDTHDPCLLKNIEKAAGRIWQAIDAEEKICIFSDYDVDGVCSAAILHDFFDSLDCPVGVYIPDRIEEGHGLSDEAISYFIEEEAELVITLDSGITGHEKIARAQEAGIDIIVTDHHQVVGGLPGAYTVVNQHQKGDTYPFKGLCGAGLAFKLVQVLVQDGRISGRWRAGQEKWLLDLVALASVADMMPMRDENRALVRYGLFVLARTRRPGLLELFSVARVRPQFDAKTFETNITESTIGFVLGPRINAASRMAHGGLAFDLLTTKNTRAGRTFALELEEHNKKRKRSVDTIERALYKRLATYDKHPPFIIECSEKWPASLLGLVAGRASERYGRPVMLADASREVLKASLRAPEHYDLMQALASVEEHLVQYGGHEAAAGCTFKKSKLEAVREGLRAHAENYDNSLHTKTEYEPLAISLADITLENVELIERLAPFGEGNPRPRFVVKEGELVNVDLLGKKNNHAKLYITDGTCTQSMLLFFHNGEADKLTEGERYNVVGELSVNEWNGRRNPQFKILNIEHA